jgi:NADH dehydrogenase [ubiquinone] 1 alpha subcomplex assembly factor 5
LFDMKLRAQRRDRAARAGVELFLYGRAFEDCLERIAILQRRFNRALLIGSPDPDWPKRLGEFAELVDVQEPGEVFAAQSNGAFTIEDAWAPVEAHYEIVLGIGTLDTDALFMGALSGGDTLPQLRAAMREADAVSGAAAPHVHPRIEASALAPLLVDAGFVNPVVDLDRVSVSYPSLDRLVGDLRAMGATNILAARPRFVGRVARLAATTAFAAAGDSQRTLETFEILNFAAWTPKKE